MDPTLTETIDKHGYPLGFKIREGSHRTAGRGRDVFKVEARQLAGHQKEAVVTEGTEGHAWRLTSDEGTHLRGTDLAPFPLGFFNAGIQSDLYGRIRDIGAAQSVAIDDVEIRVANHYWLTGSFINGTGEGHAEQPDIDVIVQSTASTEVIKQLVADAMNASPTITFLRKPLSGNTFALYINGRRRLVDGVDNSTAPDAVDPYRVYKDAPRPLDQNHGVAVIEKSAHAEQGSSELASPTVKNKLIRNIFGEGRSLGDGLYETDSWLGMPGMTHFKFVSDESAVGAAPLGLAFFSAGISFCYMTQLSRYIENMKMNIRGVRLVQYNPYVYGAKAGVEPIDTHLFLNGEAPDETHLQLLSIAARTCYLHAAAKTPTEPNVRIVHNGSEVARAA